jgi:hypothetical protein
MSFNGELIFNHSFTLHTWIKIVNSAGTIFSINRDTTAATGEEEYFEWGYTNTRQVFDFAIGNVVVINSTSNANAYVQGSWQF